MINSVALMGRLTADPELRKTTSETSVTAFTVAIDRRYQKQGEDRKADFLDCVAWRNTAEFICKYFTKGKLIALVGEIQTRSYEDKNGQKRKAVEIVASQASFCESKSSGANESGSVGEPESLLAPSGDFEEIGDNEDLPF